MAGIACVALTLGQARLPSRDAERLTELELWKATHLLAAAKQDIDDRRPLFVRPALTGREIGTLNQLPHLARATSPRCWSVACSAAAPAT
jgi:hypothetical protein